MKDKYVGKGGRIDRVKAIVGKDKAFASVDKDKAREIMNKRLRDNSKKNI